MTYPTLAEAMDSTRTFSTGGDSSFAGSSYSPYYYYYYAAAHSGSISDNEESWMQTTYTASAGDKVSFYWKVSSESGDYVKFYIDYASAWLPRVDCCLDGADLVSLGRGSQRRDIQGQDFRLSG